MKNLEEAQNTAIAPDVIANPTGAGPLPKPPMLWLLIPLGLLVVLALLSRA